MGQGCAMPKPKAGPAVSGRKTGPDQRDELLRIWGHVDEDGRKMMLFFARQLAREQGLVPTDTPLMITDRVF